VTKIELFVSPTCPYCPGAKNTVHEVAAQLNAQKQGAVEIVEYDTFTPQGSAKASEYGVTHVPTLFISGSGIPQKILLDDAPTQKDLLDAIEMAQGTKKIERKKGFFERLLGK